MVATEDNPVGLEDSRPAGRFQGLGRLVDEKGSEMVVFHDMVGAANQRAANHAGLLEEVGVDFNLQFHLAFAEASQEVLSLMRRLAGGALTQGAPDVPQFRVVGVVSIAPFIAALEHFVAHLQRVANAEHVDATLVELFANPVHRSVTGSAYQHLGLALESLDDSLDERCRLARSRGTMDNSHIHSGDDLTYSTRLHVVKPGDMERRLLTETGFERAYQHLAEVDKFLIVRAHGCMERLVHDTIGGVIDGDPNAH